MGFDLTILGCATPYPRPGHPCSGYLLRTPETRLLIDCGSGVFASLQEHLPPEDLTAIWVSHLHPDHAADLFAVFNWIVNTPGIPPLPVYAPTGWRAGFQAFTPGDHAPELLTHAFHAYDITDGQEIHINDLHLHTRHVPHIVPTYALRAHHHGHTIAYSADSGPGPHLQQLAHNTDVFLCAAGAITPRPGHLTPTQAGQHAHHAHTRHLILTHLPHNQNHHTARTHAQEHAHCPITIAAPGQHIPITHSILEHEWTQPLPGGPDPAP
jgi:ribonuclease BN (tRNA processing enzyme)